MPDAEVGGTADEAAEASELEEKGLLLDGGMRPSELVRMRGVEAERGTGSKPDDGRAGV